MSMTKITIDTSLTARQIMDTYDVPKSTAYRAKKKGFYFHSKQVDPATRKQQARFLEVMALPALTNSNLEGVSVQKFYDIQREKSTLSRDEYANLKVELLALRAKLRNFVKNPNIFTFRICIFANRLVKHHVLITDRSLVERFRSGVKVPASDFEPYAPIVNKFIRDLKL